MSGSALQNLDGIMSGKGRAAGGNRSVDLVSALLLAVALAVLVMGATGIGLSPYIMNLLGQVAAFGLLAIALDLIWGYAGILSLGHGLYFAIGGYLIAMHMVKLSFLETQTPPDFMLFMGWKTLPVYYAGMEYFAYVVGLIGVLTAIVAATFGFISFRSRISGVYFAIITQALVYVAMLLFFRNDTGFGGNNGMTGFTTLLGMQINDRLTVALLCASSIAAVAVALFGCNRLVSSRFGHMLVAIRDDEARLRFLGYETVWIKVLVWVLSALLAAVAGMLYVPQVGIINPRVLAPELSLEIAVWVAVGGRGSLVGALLGAIAINMLKFWLTASAPAAWPFILSFLILAIAVALPNGMLSASDVLRKARTALGRQPVARSLP